MTEFMTPVGIDPRGASRGGAASIAGPAPAPLELGEMLGQGSYGKVYRVLGRDLAMKQMNIDPEFGIPELKELSLLRIVNHPNILRLEDFVVTPAYVGLVLPLAKSDLAKRRAFRSLEDALLCKWMYQLLSAMHFLHRNSYYHCDIKPANVLIINGDAVLSDLGLTGNVMNIGACQSYPSPQLYVKRGTRMDSPIANTPSNEYQDDVWALGVTFFIMITGRQQPFHRSTSIDAYCATDTSAIDFLASALRPPYLDLLARLLNPSAVARSLNLLELLALPIFTENVDFPRRLSRNYIDGSIISVPNDNPIIFVEGVGAIVTRSIATFRLFFKQNQGACPDVTLPYIMLFNAIDIMYRIYMFTTHSGTGLVWDAETIACCFYISAKIFGLTELHNLLFVSVDWNPMVRREPLIVNLLRGYLTRDLVIKYLDPSQYEKFLDWLQANPERYEQCSLSKLAEIARSL